MEIGADCNVRPQPRDCAQKSIASAARVPPLHPLEDQVVADCSDKCRCASSVSALAIASSSRGRPSIESIDEILSRFNSGTCRKIVFVSALFRRPRQNLRRSS